MGRGKKGEYYIWCCFRDVLWETRHLRYILSIRVLWEDFRWRLVTWQARVNRAEYRWLESCFTSQQVVLVSEGQVGEAEVTDVQKDVRN